MSRINAIILMAAVILISALVLPFQTVQVVAIPAPSDVWVAPSPLGDNNNSGTEAQPFATIQWGINRVASEGTVHVSAGTYHENLLISVATNLTGAGAQDTIVDGGRLGTVITISSEPNTPNMISGFTIQNGLAIPSLQPTADRQALFAGINLPLVQTLHRLFSLVPSQGGGIYISETHIVTLSDCVIKDNQADYGGGIYNVGQLYMNRCTVSGNSAVYEGGGIYHGRVGIGESGKMWLTNCTISGNNVEGGTPCLGGGIFNGGNLQLLNCTIAFNSATSGWGGGYANVCYTATFKNTIVANNTADDSLVNNGHIEPPGLTVSQGHNLDSQDSCGFNQPTDLINTDPLLSLLQDNGGPTFTHALLHGSPAIDKGGDPIAVVTDQRGVPRPQGPAVDIGAYELAQASVNTATEVGTASFSTLNGYITDLASLKESQTDCGPSPILHFPFGLFSFNVTDITPGSTITVVIILPSNAPTDIQYWKCINGQWVDCSSLLGSNDGDSVLTLTITDGGLGDRDGEANGQISDPGGPVAVVPTQSGPKVSPTLPRLLNPPQMSLQYLSVSPRQATANQPVTISTNVVNTGDAGGNYNVALKINGQVEQTRMVSVGPQASQPIKFAVTRAQPGTYSVDINGQKGSFTILGGQGTGKAPVNGGLIVILVLGVLVIASVMVLLLSRRPA